MRKILCAACALMMILGCAAAEENPAALWQHEAGWLAFSEALGREGTEEAWEAGAEAFGAGIGLADLSGEQLKAMMMKGFALENGVDELQAEGCRFTGKASDGTVLFSHEYALAEILEEADILGGVKVYVFRTAEEGAGAYTCLLMTEPVASGEGEASYVTFNLVHTGDADYRAALRNMLPCPMTEKDTGMAGLAYAIQKLFSGPVTVQ